jgi:soluble lytic murein transglycosylase-like protein
MIYDPFDPAENIWAGSRYLGWLLKMYNGDIINALAAYNAGMGAVNRYGGLPPYTETVNYVRRVLDFWKQSKGVISQ